MPEVNVVLYSNTSKSLKLSGDHGGSGMVKVVGSIPGNNRPFFVEPVCVCVCVLALVLS